MRAGKSGMSGSDKIPFPASRPLDQSGDLGDPDAALREELSCEWSIELGRKLAKLLLEEREKVRRLEVDVERLRLAAGIF
jgi:hypothetical protein